MYLNFFVAGEAELNEAVYDGQHLPEQPPGLRPERPLSSHLRLDLLHSFLQPQGGAATRNCSPNPRMESHVHRLLRLKGSPGRAEFDTCGCGRRLRFCRDRKFSIFLHHTLLPQPHASNAVGLANLTHTLSVAR